MIDIRCIVMEHSNYRAVELFHVITSLHITSDHTCCCEDGCMLLVDAAEMRAGLLIGMEVTSLGED